MLIPGAFSAIDFAKTAAKNQKAVNFKNMIIMLVILYLAIFCANSFAAHMLPLKESVVIKLKLSSRDFNRIKVSDDRINQAFANFNELFMEKDELLGQLFIKPKSQQSKPIALTLTTEKGKTQDFLFEFADVCSQTVILTNPAPKLVQSLDLNERASRLLQEFSQGLHKDSKKANRAIAVRSPWKLKLKSFSKKDNLIAHKLELTNTSRQIQKIRACNLWQDSTLAMQIDNENLGPGVTTVVWLVSDSRGMV